MTLRELTARLQALCHDGYSLHEAEFVLDGYGTVRAEELTLVFRSDATRDGMIRVELGK